ncbi:MAG: OmpA family protein [Paludibacter sp.]|nr:OmpA family protein [Paludibacter sp.]
MKRFLIFICYIFLTIIVYPENKDFSRWSFSPEVGINRFDGDAVQQLTDPFVRTDINLTYGLSLEYAINPIWGLSLDYLNIPFNGIYTSPLDTFKTKLSNVNLSVTINFTRLIFPNTNSKFYISGSFGLGLAYYNFDVKTVPNTTALSPPYGNAGSIPVAMTFEYNVSKSFSLGFRARYITFTKDNLEGVKAYQGVTNDRIAMGSLFLTYKLNAKNKDHLRNLKMNDFSPDEGLQLAKLNNEKIRKLDADLHKLDKKVDNQSKRIDSIAKILSNDGPDSDGDGVPDVRDMEPNTPPNTAVDFWGRAYKQNPISNGNYTTTNNNNNTNNTICDDVPSVYFDFDRIDLDDNALIAISKIAKKMKDEPSLFVEVRGYCDYIGRNPYNETLSKRRAERVKTELVKIWKIPANHIIANGKGKILEPRIRYKPNRRCDFFFGTP